MAVICRGRLASPPADEVLAASGFGVAVAAAPFGAAGSVVPVTGCAGTDDADIELPVVGSTWVTVCAEVCPDWSVVLAQESVRKL